MRLFICGLVAFGALGFDHPSLAAEAHYDDSVKAAFIFRFAGYVDWPTEAVPIQSFTIAVIGSKEVESQLRALVSDRTLHGRPVTVRKISRVQEAADAQILYIGPNHLVNLKYLVQALSGRGILIVTDEPGGLESGSAINLLKLDQKVRFEVSADAARRAGLDINSGLLSMAVRVEGNRSPAELVIE